MRHTQNNLLDVTGLCLAHKKDSMYVLDIYRHISVFIVYNIHL
jgi:hypothetical protein